MRADIHSLLVFGGDRQLLVSIDEASARELEQASGGHVVSNVVDEVETILLAILGRVGDAVLDRVQDGLDRDLFAIFEELARDARAERATKNAHRQFGASGTHETSDTDDLAMTHVEGGP